MEDFSEENFRKSQIKSNKKGKKRIYLANYNSRLRSKILTTTTTTNLFTLNITKR